MTPYDQFLWETFHDSRPDWNLVRYDGRPIIKNHLFEIEARTLEIAIKAAIREMRNRSYYLSYYRSYYRSRVCWSCGRRL